MGKPRTSVLFDRDAFEWASSIVLAERGIRTRPLAALVEADLVLRRLLHEFEGKHTPENQGERDDLHYWIAQSAELLAGAIRQPQVPPGTKATFVHSTAERRVRAALSTMPGGGAHTALHTAASLVGFDRSGPRGVPIPISMDSIADYLDAFSEIRKSELVEHDATRTRLRGLEDDLAAAGRLFQRVKQLT